ncbi:MAG: hypothetical protein ABEJ92_11350 [Halobacteriales archaeon]
MQVEFECVVCGHRAVATVRDDDAADRDRPLSTLRDCPDCGMETIWLEA